MPARPRAWLPGLVVPTCLLAGVALGLAQEPVRLEVLDAGRPVAGIEVTVLVQGEPWSLGVTDAEGAVLAPLDLVDLVPGVFVEAQAVACGARTSVVLVPPGESPGVACRAEPGCRCRALASFPWGDASLDLAPPSDPDRFGPERRPPGVARAGAPRWLIGAGAGIAGWPRLDRACGTGFAAPPVGCDLDAQAPIFRVVVEHRPRADLPFAWAAEAGYIRGLAVEQRFAASANPRDPVRNVVDLEVWTVGGYGVFAHGRDGLSLRRAGLRVGPSSGRGDLELHGPGPRGDRDAVRRGRPSRWPRGARLVAVGLGPPYGGRGHERREG